MSRPSGKVFATPVGLAVVISLVVVSLFVVLAGAIGGAYAVAEYAIHQNQVEQQQQGRIFEAKLCKTLYRVKEWKAPAGNPADNPSRKALDQLHADLAPLGADVGCK